MAAAESIEDICKRLVKTDRIDNCNWFVQAVGKALWNAEVGFLAGTANEIVPRLADKTNFVPLGGNGGLATKYANDGYLVIGGLAQAAGSGHVFVVVPGGPAGKGLSMPWKDAQGKPYLTHGGYPYAYNGAANATLRIPERITVEMMFKRSDLASVTYGAVADPRKKASAAGTATTGAAGHTASASTIASWMRHVVSSLF